MLRIAFDLDGVLADMESELVRQAKLLFGERGARRSPERARNAPEPPSGSETSREPSPEEDRPPLVGLELTARQQSRLWRHVEAIEGFWESLKEIEPGVIAQLATIATDRRWEVIFLTKRPETAGATAQVQSQRWLDARGFRMPSVCVVQGSRGHIAAALGLDVVVDDRPENCLDVVADSRARAVLVWRKDDNLLPAATRRLGIGVVKSVAECLSILREVDSSVGEGPRLVDRMKRLFGRKETARV